jgi:hypothetical protein
MVFCSTSIAMYCASLAMLARTTRAGQGGSVVARWLGRPANQGGSRPSCALAAGDSIALVEACGVGGGCCSGGEQVSQREQSGLMADARQHRGGVVDVAASCRIPQRPRIDGGFVFFDECLTKV